MKRLWIPKEMQHAAPLTADAVAEPPRRRYALLINPFYPKDPHASYRKARADAVTGVDEYRGRNPARMGGRVLGREPAPGPAPWSPFPQVVGITVHLTFAGQGV